MTPESDVTVRAEAALAVGHRRVLARSRTCRCCWHRRTPSRPGSTRRRSSGPWCCRQERGARHHARLVHRARHGRVSDAGQPMLLSPSETVAVMVTGPGAVHAKVGVAVLAPVRVPERGRPLVRRAATARRRCRARRPERDGSADENLTRLAETPSRTGHMLICAIDRDAARGGRRWQSRPTVTVVAPPTR